MSLPPCYRCCNRCNIEYLPDEGYCPTCGCPEFRLPDGTVQEAEDAKKKQRTRIQKKKYGQQD